jgi:hypothetical protein
MKRINRAVIYVALIGAISGVLGTVGVQSIAKQVAFEKRLQNVKEGYIASKGSGSDAEAFNPDDFFRQVRDDEVRYPYTLSTSVFPLIDSIVNTDGSPVYLEGPYPKCPPSYNYCCAISQGAELTKIKELESGLILYGVQKQDLTQAKACPFTDFFFVSSSWGGYIRRDMSFKVGNKEIAEAIQLQSLKLGE